MSLHRINDNTLLDDEEYEDHVDGNWALGLFIIGAIAAGILTFNNLGILGADNAPKWLKFTIIVIASAVSGYLLSKLRNVVRLLLFLCVSASIIGFIAYFIWMQL
ncbi:hypothetical protein DXX93_00250 [Thalassotalea euphylliae]|uniref:Uncharacterized protein n=1 Tax=Thalassotalea euphylliae TaxID=1655234 RepID=A0A3E0TLR0_9GAMM|nr:hypothetical protein [Thalassotalea euphylliae]REL25132.1 hypothetical protein DXX93_00250 [Thalassotalea euphylliae]